MPPTPARAPGELRTWLTESHTAELFYQYPISLSALASLPQPDRAGVWADAGREIAFMLEYDTSSEHLAQLAGKLDSYARLADVLSRYHQQVPLLLFCFLTPRREQTARHALAASADSLGMRIATAVIDPRVTCPAGHVWMPLHSSVRQIRLIDLDAIPFEAAQSASTADPYR